MNEVGMNAEWVQLKLRAEYLRGSCAEKVEEYMHLVNCVGPNLKAKYMVEIGQFEYRVYEMKLLASRWKRRFTLRQQALNRGEKPDVVKIEATLDAEFAEYRKEVRIHQAEIEAASQHYSCEALSDEENGAIRLNYLNAVKKLHPDLNPDLPESAKELWNQIQRAYAARDWRSLAFLTGLVDEVIGGQKMLTAESGLDALKVEIGRLEMQLKAATERISELMKTEPFCWQEILNDEDDLKHRRNELIREIDELDEALRDYEELWNGREAA